MEIAQHCDVNFHYNGAAHHGTLRIETREIDSVTHYRAVIETSALHGTYGGYAESIALALDFLNLAMQAEGADEIAFHCLDAKGDSI